MILTRLDEILKEKNISINKLSSETGISRKALTSLVNNDSKGIQFNTLEKLINYLDISIQDFFRDDRESVLLSFMDIKKAVNPIYSIELISSDSKLNEIMIVQSIWNFESDLDESIRYFSTPILATGLINRDNNNNVLYGFSFSMDDENINKEDKDNFLFILNNLNKNQLYSFVLNLLSNFVDANLNIRELIPKIPLTQIPIFFSYYNFNDLLIFEVIHGEDGDIEIDFESFEESNENVKIKTNITNVDLSKYLK